MQRPKSASERSATMQRPNSKLFQPLDSKARDDAAAGDQRAKSKSSSEDLALHVMQLEGPSISRVSSRLDPDRKKRLAKVCPLILGNELCERMAYYGITFNLIVYLTSKLGVDNAQASSQVTTWSATCYLTPLLGAFLADSYIGRYWTIITFSLVYVLGLVLLTLSAALPALSPVAGQSPSSAQLGYFWLAMYLIALGTGGIKPCVSSFGADQFREDVPAEAAARSSFFSWFYFVINIGSLIASLAIVYIQTDVSWAWGFATPAMAFVLAIILFLAGTRLYTRLPPSGSPFSRLATTAVAAFKKRKLPVPEHGVGLFEVNGESNKSAIPGARKMPHTPALRCIDHAAVLTDSPKLARWTMTITHCEEIKAILQLLPVLLTTIVFQVVYNQMSTLFVLQGTTMERSLGSLSIPSASMSFVDTISVMICVILYDSLVVPFFKRIGRPISMLQRIGSGYVFAMAAMIVAALVETARLRIVDNNNLQNVDYTITPVPMSIWWQVPQYFLIGAAEVGTNIGCMELFYAHAPDSMRSTSTAIFYLSSAISGYITSALYSGVQRITAGDDPSGGWISNNLNVAHIDNFFWLLVVLQALALMVYVPIAYAFKERAPLQGSAADCGDSSSEDGEGADADGVCVKSLSLATVVGSAVLQQQHSSMAVEAGALELAVCKDGSQERLPVSSKSFTNVDLV